MYRKISCLIFLKKKYNILVSVSLDSTFCTFLCGCVFLVGLWALFIGPTSTEKYKSNFKTGSRDIIRTFKYYFATVFSVISGIQTDPKSNSRLW